MPASPGSIALLVAVASLLVLLSAASVLIPVPPGVGGAEGFAVAEGFADPVKMRPCAVYYTENIAACDHPAALYEKSPEWRKFRAAQLKDNKTPTAAESEEKTLLAQIAAEETQKKDKMPKFCKVPFSGFTEIADDPRKVESQAAARGPAEHWAFCYKPNPDAGSASASAVAFGDRGSVVANRDTITNMGDANVYNRIQFRSLEYGEVKRAMCVGPRPTENVLAETVPVLLALTVDPFTMKLQSIGAVQRSAKGELIPFDNWLGVFSRLFRAKGANYQYLMVPASMQALVYMVSKNICDQHTVQGTYPVTVNLASAGAAEKVIVAGMPYSAPSRAAMVQGISEIQDKINEVNATLADLTSKYNTVTSSTAGGLNRLVYLINSPDHWPQNTAQMNTMFANRLRLVKQDTDKTINYRSDTRVPGVREGYAIEWRGLIKAPATGTYWFNMNSDDAGDAYVDGKLVTTYYGGHWFNKQGVSVTGVRLEAGAFYSVHIRMMEWWGDDGMELSVRSDAPGVGNTWQLLPTSWCYYSTDPNMNTYIAKMEYSRLQAQTLGQRKSEYEHWITKLNANQGDVVKRFAAELVGKDVSGMFQRAYMSDDNKIYVDVGAYMPGQDAASQEVQGNSDQQVLLSSAIQLTSASVIAPPYVPLHQTPKYSVSMWIKVMAGSTSWRNVFFYGADDDWTNWEARKNNNPLIDRTPGFWIYPDNTTRLHYRHRAMTEGGFNDGIDVTDVAVLPAFAQWFHYSTTISGNQAKTYINGRLVASRTLGGNFEWNDMKPKKLRLGKDGISAGVYLQKFYWYNRVLTDAEVATLAGEIKYSYATGRYIRLQRKTWPPGGQVQGYLNILELAAYGTAGQVLPATPSLWPQYGGTGSFGPQFLADKITRADWWLGGAAGGLPHTTNHPQSYMELDLRGMQEVRSIVIENRRDCCTSRIVGTELQVLDANRRVVWSTLINNDQPTYRFTPQL
jgi:hypothetical protein